MLDAGTRAFLQYIFGREHEWARRHLGAAQRTPYRSGKTPSPLKYSRSRMAGPALVSALHNPTPNAGTLAQKRSQCLREFFQ
jgi:hypothetical protein